MRWASSSPECARVDPDVDTLAAALRIGERQVVEIARALSDEARCLILDEPTAALEAREVDALFELWAVFASGASR